MTGFADLEIRAEDKSLWEYGPLGASAKSDPLMNVLVLAKENPGSISLCSNAGHNGKPSGP